MAKLWEMLDQAYYYINNDRHREAQYILDQVLSADPRIWMPGMPTSTSATRKMIWKTCVIISSTYGIRECVTATICSPTQRFVLQRLEEKMSSL